MEFSQVMDDFLELYNDNAKLCEMIYYSDVEELGIDKFEYLGLSHKILDTLKREELIKYIIVKG